MACAIYQGAYDRIGEAYNALLTWIEVNGYRSAGPNRDVYLQPPKDGAASPVTEVQFPVQKKPTSVFVSGTKEKDQMEPKIVSKPAFTAVGLEYYGKNEHNEIGLLWEKLNPRMGEIKNIIDGAFGLCQAPRLQRGFQVTWPALLCPTPKILPQGMQVWDVPAQTYAVFPVQLKTIHETYRNAFEAWIPAAGYQHTNGPDFEYYDEPST